jgi:hypothetical protein
MATKKSFPFKDVAGYEVIRDGQGYSVKETKPGDIIVKTISRSGFAGAPITSGKMSVSEEIKKESMPSFISAAPVATKKLDVASNYLRDRIQRIRTQQLRDEITPKNQAEIFALSGAKSIVDNLKDVRDTPQTAELIYSQVKGIRTVSDLKEFAKNIETGIRQEGASFGQVLKESPGEAVAVVGTNVLIFKGSSKALKALSTVKDVAYTKLLDPKYLGNLKTGTPLNVLLKLRKGGGTIKVNVTKIATISDKLKGGRITKATIRKGGAIINYKRKGIRYQRIKLKPVKRIPTVSLRKQAKLSGKAVLPVSAQQNALLSLLRRTRKIKKPIGDIKLSKANKKLLKKLDKGKQLTNNEFMRLEKAISRAGSKGLLERAFFADPKGRLRLSRLGVSQKEATFLDYLSGDIRFRKGKPQVLVFPKQLTAKAPPKIQKILNKIQKGKKLNKFDKTRLLQYQLKPAKRFKPVGFLTPESEITARGLIARKKKIGSVLYKHRRVSIIQAELKKPSRKLNRLIKKSQTGRLTNKEIKRLKRLYKKETGFKLNSAYLRKGKYYPLSRRLLSGSLYGLSKIKGAKRIKYYGRIKYRTPGRPPISTYKRGYTGGGKKFIPYKLPPGRPPTYKPPIIIKRRPIIPKKPKKPLKMYPSKYLTKKESSRKIQAFNVYGRAGKRYIKLNKLPLTRKDALSRGSYAIDHSTAKTVKVIPAGAYRKLGNIKAKENRYFKKLNKKFRGYKIRKGSKYKLKNKYIERKRYGIDTRGEVKGLTLARLAKKMGYRK